MRTISFILNLIVIIIFSFNGCQNNDEKKLNEETNIDSTFICDTTQLVRTLKAINDNPKKFIKINEINDPCILRTVDALLAGFIAESKIEYLKGLENLWSVCDGYLADYLSDVEYILFKENFKVFFQYIYDKRNAQENELADLLVNSMIMEILYEDVPKNEIDDLFKEKYKSDNLNNDQKEYLIELKKRIDDFVEKSKD